MLFLRVKEQLSHTYKATGEIVVRDNMITNILMIIDSYVWSCLNNWSGQTITYSFRLQTVWKTKIGRPPPPKKNWNNRFYSWSRNRPTGLTHDITDDGDDDMLIFMFYVKTREDKCFNSRISTHSPNYAAEFLINEWIVMIWYTVFIPSLRASILVLLLTWCRYVKKIINIRKPHYTANKIRNL
jgi:hypothetical protein